MGVKRAKLNLDFGHSGICMNFAVEGDIQARNSVESEWHLISLKLDNEVFADFPGNPQNKILDSEVKNKAIFIEKKIEEWQREHGYEIDSFAEVTISASCFEVLSFPYAPGFESKVITEEDVKKIELCKQSEIPIPDKKIKAFISPYFLISNGKDLVKVSNPIRKTTKNLGFHTYFITEHPMLSRLVDIMRNDGDKVSISLSCEKEFKALAGEEERSGKTMLINITDSITEFSVWDKSELKYLNKKETGLRELKNIIWRLCLCYYRIKDLANRDYELAYDDKAIQAFYEKAKNIEIQADSRDLLSADDCSGLLKLASCILEKETEYNPGANRMALPGKNNSKTNLSISNYVLSYFTKEAIRGILSEIKHTVETDKFCEPEYVIIECSLPLKGLEKLATGVFGIPVKRKLPKWAGEHRDDFSVAGIGALKGLISGEYPVETKKIRKKTRKISTLLGNFFNRA